MKICPKCQTKFNQNESFCSKDGTKLDDITPAKKGSLSGGTLDKVARLEKLLTVDLMAERYSGVLVDENQPTWITVFNQQFVPIASAKKRMETARSLVGAPLPKEINIALRSNFDHTPPYIVHSEPAGPSVRELLDKEERLPWELAAKIIASTARVLEWLHEHGILFRAIHPGAIYVSDRENGKVQIAEWAYDSLMDIESPLEALKEDNNAFVGYANYLAPELAENFEEGDVRSTVYALGILLYEMLTGIAPMKAATPAEVLSRHKLEKPLPIKLAAPNIKLHPELSGIVDRMLAKKKENRFQAPGTIIAVLSNLLGTTPIELAPKLTRNSDMREDELFQTIDMESVDRSSIPELAPLKKDVQEIKKTLQMNSGTSKRKTSMMPAVSTANEFDAKPSIEVNFGEEKVAKSIEVNFDATPEPKKPIEIDLPKPKATLHFIKPVLEAPKDNSEELAEKDQKEEERKEKAELKKQKDDQEQKHREAKEKEKAQKLEEEKIEKERQAQIDAQKIKDDKAAKEKAAKEKAAEEKTANEKAEKAAKEKAEKAENAEKAAERKRQLEKAKEDAAARDETEKKTMHFVKTSTSDAVELVSEVESRPTIEVGNRNDGAHDAEWFSTSKDEAWERSFEREGNEESESQQRRIILFVVLGAILLGVSAFVYFEFLYEAEPDEQAEEAAAVVPDKASEEKPKPEETEEVLIEKFTKALNDGLLISPVGSSAASHLEKLSILVPESEGYKNARSEFAKVVLEKSATMPVEAAVNVLREAKKLDPENKDLEARFSELNAKLAGTEEKPEDQTEEDLKKAEELEKAEEKKEVEKKEELKTSEKKEAEKTAEKEKTKPEDTKEKVSASELIKKARSAYGRNQASAAKKLYQEAYRIAPSDHRVTGGLAAIYFDQGNYAKAVTYYKKAVSRSGSVKYRISLGQAYYRLGRYKSAIKAWKSALKKSPNNKSAKSYIKLAERKLR